MTSTQKPNKLSPSFSYAVKEIFSDPGRLLLIWFLVLSFHSAYLGMSDDEAYYWVLSRTPAAGYAYHPPGVAWLLAFFGHFGTHPFWVRLPAILVTIIMLGVAFRWLLDLGAKVNNSQ